MAKLSKSRRLCRTPWKLVTDGRDRERQVRVRMDRRQRFFGNRVGFDYRRMRSTPTMIGAVPLAAAGIAVPLLATEISPTERRSGYSFMTPATQAIQNDDTTNPGMLGVLDGENLWKRKTGALNQACADCHNDVRASMRGVAAGSPPSPPET